jgi:hypothetical protein
VRVVKKGAQARTPARSRKKKLPRLTAAAFAKLTLTDQHQACTSRLFAAFYRC